VRLITHSAAEALINDAYFSRSNTQVMNGVMYLFGNAIAKKENGIVYINNQGFHTATTKE